MRRIAEFRDIRHTLTSLVKGVTRMARRPAVPAPASGSEPDGAPGGRTAEWTGSGGNEPARRVGRPGGGTFG